MDEIKFGKPVQLLAFNKKSKCYSLNKETVELILNQEHVKDCYVSVISIVGAFREGKSFILNFFIRYLDAISLNKADDWLEDDNIPLTGFELTGYDRHTPGIWIWSKLYVVERNGVKIAVMIMDTQGVHDTETSSQDNMTIFSLSTLLSSIQIFNVKEKIQERDLQYLQLICEYGKIANENVKIKPFQRLLFLIRDWRYLVEAEYGFSGAEKVLTRVLKPQSNQIEELCNVRKHVYSTFENISGCLMPFPGECVITPNFKGKISDMNGDFIYQLRNFVSNIFDPEYLIVKKLNGEGIQAKNLCHYIETCFNIFQANRTPTANNIFEATAIYNHEMTYLEALKYYSCNIKEKFNCIIEVPTIKQTIEMHEALAQEALEMLNRKAVMGSDKMHIDFIRELSSKLEEFLRIRLVEDEEKRVIQNTIQEQEYNQAIQKFNSEIKHMKQSLKERDSKVEMMEKIDIDKLKKKDDALQKIAQISDTKTKIIAEQKIQLKKFNILLQQERDNFFQAKHEKDLLKKEIENITQQLQNYETEIQKILTLSDDQKHKLIQTESNLKEWETKASQALTELQLQVQSEANKIEIIREQENDIQNLQQINNESNNEKQMLNRELDEKIKNFDEKIKVINELKSQNNKECENLLQAEHEKDLLKKEIENITQQLQNYETEIQKILTLSDDQKHKLIQTESNLKEWETKASQALTELQLQVQSEANKIEIIREQENDIQNLQQINNESNNEKQMLNRELDEKIKNFDEKIKVINELKSQNNKLLEDEEKRLVQMTKKEQDYNQAITVLNTEINNMKQSLEERDKKVELLEKMNTEQKENFEKMSTKMNIDIKKFESKNNVQQKEITEISDAKTKIVEKYNTQLEKLNIMLQQEHEKLMLAQHGKDLINKEKENITQQLEKYEKENQKLQKLSDERYHKLKLSEMKASEVLTNLRVKETSEANKAETIKKQEKDIENLQQTINKSNNEKNLLNQELGETKKNLDAKEQMINNLHLQIDQDLMQLQLNKKRIKIMEDIDTENKSKIQVLNQKLQGTTLRLTEAEEHRKENDKCRRGLFGDPENKKKDWFW